MYLLNVIIVIKLNVFNSLLYYSCFTVESVTKIALKRKNKPIENHVGVIPEINDR